MALLVVVAAVEVTLAAVVVSAVGAPFSCTSDIALSCGFCDPLVRSLCFLLSSIAQKPDGSGTRDSILARSGPSHSVATADELAAARGSGCIGISPPTPEAAPADDASHCSKATRADWRCLASSITA